MTVNLFFELVRCGATGATPDVEMFHGDVAWVALMEMATRQALVGVTFEAVRQLPKEVAPPKEVLMRWLGMAQQVAAKNTLLDERAAEAERYFAERGFESCILKGQGMARLYPNPKSRQPGDIDLWVKTHHLTPSLLKRGEPAELAGRGKAWSLSKHRKEVVKIVRETTPEAQVCYHHVDARLFEDAEVEVHFTPSWMFSPFKNRRLQRFFREEASKSEAVKGVGFHVPSQRLNVVYILVHIYRHLFDEGVGLRQVVDWARVLNVNVNGNENGNDMGAMKVLKELGMERFTKGMMWVMQRVLGLERTCMLCEPDEKEGCFLLSEIMRAGNFGRYDTRNRHGKDETAWGRLVRKMRRNWHFVMHYPSEVLWSPAWKAWHWVWRKAAYSVVSRV